MSGKKKNLITLISLSVVLVICLVLYFVIPQGKSDGTEENAADTTEQDSTGESEENITIDTIASDQIDTVTVKRKEKESWSLQQQKKGTWKLTGMKGAPVNSETVSAILSNVNPVKATQKFEAQTGALSSYGLDQPTLTIQIQTKDGKTYQYDIGSEVPKSDLGYYGKTADGKEIYCIDTALVKSFDVPATQLVKMDPLPEPETEYLTSLSVKSRKGKEFEAKKVSDKDKVDFYSNWNITAPYAKPLATSQSEWSTVLGYFTGLSYEEMVEYNSTNLKKYGLERPAFEITMTYYQAVKGYTPTATATPAASVSGNSSSDSVYVIPEEKREYKTLRLCIGKKKDDSYYVCEKGKQNVYKMSASMVENMTGLDAYTNMDHCVYSVLATSIKGYDVTYGNTTLKVTRKSVPKKETDATATPASTASEEGTAVGNATDSSQKNIWTLNGKTISDDKESDFLRPYSQAFLLEYSERAENSVKPKSKEPVLTIVYHEENRDVTVKYLPYDGINFYRVDKNGMDYFLVDKLLVDDVIEKFKGIEKMG